MNDQPVQKIIIIGDDDLFITHAYKVGLEEAGYRVIIAEDGEAVIRQVKMNHPNLVITELILPKLDGFSVLKALKEDPEVANIPVLVLTSLSQQPDLAEAMRLGAAECMVKDDVSLNDVLAQVNQLLKVDIS